MDGLIVPGSPCPHETIYKQGLGWRCRDCGEPVDDPEPFFEVRLWIDGTLVEEGRVTAANAGDLATWHTASVISAIEAGRKWMVEITDPSLPEDKRHLRFGSDEMGMVDPQLRPIDEILGEAERRFGE